MSKAHVTGVIGALVVAEVTVLMVFGYLTATLYRDRHSTVGFAFGATGTVLALIVAVYIAVWCRRRYGMKGGAR